VPLVNCAGCKIICMMSPNYKCGRTRPSLGVLFELLSSLMKCCVCVCVCVYVCARANTYTCVRLRACLFMCEGARARAPARARARAHARVSASVCICVCVSRRDSINPIFAPTYMPQKKTCRCGCLYVSQYCWA